MYIGALRLTGENDRLQSHDSFFFCMFGTTKQSQNEMDTDMSKKSRKPVMTKVLELKVGFRSGRTFLKDLDNGMKLLF